MKYSVTPEKLLTVVASFAEAWIEIDNARISDNADYVASFAEAWIEIKKTVSRCLHLLGRLLRGGVD